MLIGVLSDTHDRVEAMAAAIELLRQREAEFFIHCGDVGSTRVLDYLAGLPSAFVWGNCDYDRLGLARYAEKLGIQCFGAYGELELGGKLMGVLHGDDPKAKEQMLSGGRFDYIVQGHTHQREDRRIGRTRLINPGALHRANPKTVALLETAADTVEFLVVGLP
jgi:putative phosphoesterase